MPLPTEKPIKVIHWPRNGANNSAVSIQRHWEAKGFRVHFETPKEREQRDEGLSTDVR